MIMLLPRFATTTSLRWLLFALAFLDTEAVICNIETDDHWGGDPVSSQFWVDEKFAGCTEIYGTLYIADNYTGPLSLPGVTYIYGGISNTYDSSFRAIPSPYLSSIELPDLNYTSSLSIIGAHKLRKVSFSSLTAVSEPIFLTGLDDCAVDFPSLTTTEGLRVIGNPKTMNFPLLVSGGDVRVSKNPYSSADVALGNYLLVDRVDNNPLNISFPALQNATSVYIQGNISSLSMPRLSIISIQGYSSDESNVRILTYGNPLDVSLPSLSQAGGISVAGTIKSTHFPLLHKLNAFELNTSTVSNVTLEPLKAISESLGLFGNISTVSMSSITEAKGIEIQSDIEEFDCSPLVPKLKSLIGTESLSESVCHGPIHPPKSKTPLKLGLAIGLGVPIFLALVYYTYIGTRKFYRTRKDQKSIDHTPPEYELGVPPNYTTEGPPAYDATEEERREHGAVDLEGARSGDASDIRGEGESDRSAGDAASTRPGDGNSAHQERALERRLV